MYNDEKTSSRSFTLRIIYVTISKINKIPILSMPVDIMPVHKIGERERNRFISPRYYSSFLSSCLAFFPSSTLFRSAFCLEGMKCVETHLPRDVGGRN